MRRLLALLLLAALATPAIPPAAAANARWTLLVYMDADNNLEEVGIEDFLEMASVGSTADVNVVVQFDRAEGFDASHGDWTDAHRFLVTRNQQPVLANAIANLSEVNMADPQTLIDFVTWGMQTFPADRYFLDLWDHGIGWSGVVIDGSDYLTTAELGYALDTIAATTGRKIDLLGNDACRMTLEIMVQARESVDYFVGSEKDEPLEGWPYDRLLQRLTADPAMEPPELAAALVDEYLLEYEGRTPYSVALSAVSGAALDSVLQDLTAFADELIAYLPYFTQEIAAARAATEHYEQAGMAGGNEYDLYHFTERVEAEVGGPRLERLAAALRQSIEDAVLHEAHWDNPAAINSVPARNAHGLAVYFPSVLPGAEYQVLAMSQNSSWDEFLGAFGGGPRVSRPLTVAASSVDADGDGLTERVEVTATPGVNGLLAVEVSGPSWRAAREVVAVGGVAQAFAWTPDAPGWYGGAAYLFEAGDLRNFTRLPALAVEAERTVRGRVILNGTGADGSVVLRNVRTGQEKAATLQDGNFSFTVVYPAWVSDDDVLELKVTVESREAVYRFTPAWASETHTLEIVFPPGVVRPILGQDDIGPFLFGLVLGVLAGLAAVGIVLYLRRRRADALLKDLPR